MKNIKLELAKKLYLRRFPKIEFLFDSFAAKNIELNQKLNEIKKVSANGVILLNKHAGISSNQIDQKIKKFYH